MLEELFWRNVCLVVIGHDCFLFFIVILFLFLIFAFSVWIPNYYAASHVYLDYGFDVIFTFNLHPQPLLSEHFNKYLIFFGLLLPRTFWAVCKRQIIWEFQYCLLKTVKFQKWKCLKGAFKNLAIFIYAWNYIFSVFFLIRWTVYSLRWETEICFIVKPMTAPRPPQIRTQSRCLWNWIPFRAPGAEAITKNKHHSKIMMPFSIRLRHLCDGFFVACAFANSGSSWELEQTAATT